MTIEERLKNMERELRRQKRRNRWLLGAMLLVFGALVAIGMFRTAVTPVQAQVGGTAKTVRANNFVLEDETGKVRATLTVLKDSPSLELYDKNGKFRVGLSDSGLMLFDKNGKQGATLDTFLGLALFDENGKVCAGLDASLGLMLSDKNGKTRAALGMSKDLPRLMLFDEDDKVRAKLDVGKDGPMLRLFDENSKVLVGVEAGKDNWSF